MPTKESVRCWQVARADARWIRILSGNVPAQRENSVAVGAGRSAGGHAIRIAARVGIMGGPHFFTGMHAICVLGGWPRAHIESPACQKWRAVLIRFFLSSPQENLLHNRRDNGAGVQVALKA